MAVHSVLHNTTPRGAFGLLFFFTPQLFKMTWKEVFFGAFGIAVLQLMWRIYVWVTGRKDALDRQKYRFHKIVLKVGQVYDSMNAIVRLEPVTGCMIFKLSNGGGLPKIGSHLHTSVLYEVSSGSKHTSVKPMLQNLIVDEAYVRVMQKIVTEDYCHISVSKLEGGFLKDLLISASAKDVIFYRLHTVPEEMIYMMVEVDHDSTVLDADFESEVRIRVNQTKQLFEEISKE